MGVSKEIKDNIILDSEKREKEIVRVTNLFFFFYLAIH
jgi:hypothetical protein